MFGSDYPPTSPGPSNFAAVLEVLEWAPRAVTSVGLLIAGAGSIRPLQWDALWVGWLPHSISLGSSVVP